jgi:hypothetical protein
VFFLSYNLQSLLPTGRSEELNIPGKIWNGSWFLAFSFNQKHLGQKSASVNSPRLFAEIRRISSVKCLRIRSPEFSLVSLVIISVNVRGARPSGLMVLGRNWHVIEPTKFR